MIYKGFSFEGVLAIVAYLQLLLIGIQAEISWKQNELFSSQFEPYFSLLTLRDGGIDRVVIENKSPNMAYDLCIRRLVSPNYNHEPIKDDGWESKIPRNRGSLVPFEESNLNPGEKSYFMVGDWNYFFGKAIEITYTNKFGALRRIYTLISYEKAILLLEESKDTRIILKTFIDFERKIFNLKYIF
jgi:hypothetical protein